MSSSPQPIERPAFYGEIEVCHIVSWWQHALYWVLLRRRIPRALCGLVMEGRSGPARRDPAESVVPKVPGAVRISNRGSVLGAGHMAMRNPHRVGDIACRTT